MSVRARARRGGGGNAGRRPPPNDVAPAASGQSKTSRRPRPEWPRSARAGCWTSLITARLAARPPHARRGGRRRQTGAASRRSGVRAAAAVRAPRRARLAIAGRRARAVAEAFTIPLLARDCLSAPLRLRERAPRVARRRSSQSDDSRTPAADWGRSTSMSPTSRGRGDPRVPRWPRSRHAAPPDSPEAGEGAVAGAAARGPVDDFARGVSDAAVEDRPRASRGRPADLERADARARRRSRSSGAWASRGFADDARAAMRSRARCARARARAKL